MQKIHWIQQVKIKSVFKIIINDKNIKEKTDKLNNKRVLWWLTVFLMKIKFII